MNTFSIFLITGFISFLGSIQLGAVNLAVIKTTLDKGLKSAIFIAIGGVIPEFIYSWIALNAAEMSFLKQKIDLQWLVVPIFVGIGIFNILRKNRTNISPKPNKMNTSEIMYGFLLALFNFQLLPFWLSIIIFFNTTNLMNQVSTASKLAFTIGAGIGAFSLLTLIAYLTNLNKDFFVSIIKKYNLNAIFGCLFIILAVVQIINLLTKK